MALTLLFTVLLVGGLATLLVVAARVAIGGWRPAEPADVGASGALGRSEARRLLDERYARGELSTDEYRERVQTLEEP